MSHVGSNAGKEKSAPFGQDCSVARNVEVHTSCCYITALSDWRQRMMNRISGLTELVEKITTSRIYQK